MSIRILICLAVALLLAGCQPSDIGNVDPALEVEGSGEPAQAPEMPLGRLGDAVAPQHYELDLTIVPERERFSGRVTIEVEILEPVELIWLHGNRLNVTEAWLEQGDVRIDADYAQVGAGGVARLDLVALPQAGPASLHFEYDAPFDQALEGLYKVVEDGRAYAFTQFQATSARLAFPGFDEPAYKTPFRIHVTAPADDVVIASTPEIASRAVGDELVRRSYAETPPLPTYLLAFAVGPLDVVEWAPVPPNGIRDWPLPLRGVAVHGKGDQLAFALANTAPLVNALELYFDYEMPYPKLDIIAVPDFAAGAMENVGAITYREELLLLDENGSVNRKRRYAYVHAHELAHQWFGNLVTPKWWDDIWLNESFATWLAAKVSEQAFPELGFEHYVLGRAIDVMNADALETARQIRQPVNTNDDIADAFDGITYFKGGAMLAMFEAWVGRDEFRQGVRLHMRRFEHAAADYQDFLESLADGAGQPGLVETVSGFLLQSGVPLVSAVLSCDGGRPEIRVAQSRYLPLGSGAERNRQWEIPMCVRAGGDDGDLRHCALIDAAEATVELPVDTCPDWVMPNAEGKGYYRFSLDEDGWAALVANIDRLDAAEARVLLDSMSAAWRSGDASTQALLDVAVVLASKADREVATAPIGDLDTMYAQLAETEQARAGIAAMLRDMYAAKLDALGLALSDGDSTDDSLLRATLVALLSDEGRLASLRESLNALADGYLEDLDIASDVLDPGLVGSMLRVAVEMRDREFSEYLFRRALDSSNATFRNRVLSALGASNSPEVGAMLRGHIEDPRLRDNEAVSVAYAQAGNEAQREAMWIWTRDEANLQALLNRIPTWRKGSIVEVGADFCSVERAEQVQAMFEGRVQGLEGGPRALAQTLERIRLCAALKDEYARDVTDYFTDYASEP